MVFDINILQEKINKSGFDGYIIPNNDQFFSEYTSDQHNKLKQVTGFSGSAGIGIIMNNKVHLFTDGRYELQAKTELPKGSEIFISPKQKFADWLNEKIALKKKFAFNPKLFRYVQMQGFDSKFVQPLETDVLSDPIPKAQKLFIHELKFCRQPASDKLTQLQKYLLKSGHDFFIIEDCDSISWLLNIRSNHYEFTPTIAAKFIFSIHNPSTLFIAESKLSQDVKDYLSELNVEVVELEKFSTYLSQLKNKLVAVENTISYLVKLILPEAGLINSPITQAKAVKNFTEIKGTAKAHKRDGQALQKFYDWFANEYEAGRFYTEFELSEKLIELRSQQEHYYSPSFPPIVGFKENGAVIHYRPEKDKAKLVKGDGILLIDSGGQYYDGTTDVTRTYCLGTPTKEQQKRYTQVLKGHIAVAAAKFPQGTTGDDLDKLARQFLLADGANYAHGTGHGVGSFLNVHEGPYSISTNANLSLVENVILSIEPGYYKQGEYGIRLENLYYVKSTGKGLLGFRPLTLLPFEGKLIDYTMLTDAEKEWLEEYYKQIPQ